MIVFISDLHFEDGTAGKHNVSSDAFRIFFEQLGRQVERRSVKDVRVVLLGDVFDLLRTRFWFGVDPSMRPWGSVESRGAPLRDKAMAMLGRVRDANARTFEAFRSGVSAMRRDVPVEVTYVPGNHDRLVNAWGETRAQARDILGLEGGTDAFPERIVCAKHGVIALHGHQFDPYNHERIDRDNPDGVPIGDPITTELVSRIPTCVVAAIRRKSPSTEPARLACIERSFEGLEDVRPTSSVVQWLLSHVRNEPELEAAMHEGLDEALLAFKESPYVQRWFERHDRYAEWDDEADRLQWLMWVAGHVSLKAAGKLAGPAMRVARLVEGADPNVAAAQGLLQEAGRGVHFVVMGHTHHAKREALGVVPRPGGAPVRRVYLNTGTWRPCHYRCADGTGFLAWKEMTYTMVYAPDERPGRGAPSFETWSGTLDGGVTSRCD